ncbi:MAG: ribulose-phosphate 3-epimerase [Burkholderiales bacterium]|nr:ribulose-phosphate 3-epimerase [Burkholderiales bacterium]
MPNKTYRIAASVLSADFARLGPEIRDVSEAGADWIHFDVMDNHYVPNLTFGPMVCEAVRPYTNQPIDVHLMVEPVDELALKFIHAGANIITFHPEASKHVDRTLSLIRDSGCHAGLVFNPATPLDWLTYTCNKIDLVLLMSVNPGFGGQHFLQSTFQKIRDCRAILDAYAEKTDRHISIEVDGGVKAANIAEVAAAGANIFVAGSAIFEAKSKEGYKQVIDSFRERLGRIA